MLLSPKKTKYRKMHRGRLSGKASRNNKLEYGKFGLQALEPTWLTSRQIEACRRILSKSVKKIGKLWIKIFPHKSVTARAEESRMGSGKGSVAYWVSTVHNQNILFELDGITKEIAVKALKTASYKLPIKTKIITKL